MRRISICIVLVGAVALCACGDSSGNGGSDVGWFTDGGPDGLGWPDAPPPPPPPPPPDGGDTGGGGPLQPTFNGPYYEHTLPGTLDVNSLVTGGNGPYECSYYLGPGRGTLPADMDLTSCQLSGTFGPDDPPGVYAFIIIVEDQSGQKIEVPVVIRQGSCNTDTVTVTPAEYPVRSEQPGSAYSWQWDITDVDTPCTADPCADCEGCVKHGIGTKQPMMLTSFLDCDAEGEICFTGGDIENPDVCPNTTPVSWNAEVHVKAHDPLRTDGGVAWATVELDVTYSGDSTGMDCGGKQWACHIETLEL